MIRTPTLFWRRRVISNYSLRSRSVLALCTWLFLCAVGPSIMLRAQSGGGTIAGSVLDVTGKPIPNASVSARSESTGAARQTVTDNEGRYSLGGLSEGTYTLEASAPSFTTSRRTGLKLSFGATENVSLSLNVSELAQ